jgi:hypothetical protein
MLLHNIVTPCFVLDLLALHGVHDVVALVIYALATHLNFDLLGHDSNHYRCHEE